MRWTELRGIISVAVVVAAIAIAWSTIENRATDGEPGAVSTNSTTTTAEPPPTTLTQDDNNVLLCERARRFADETARLGGYLPGAAHAALALDFWKNALALTSVGVRAEIVAVVTYYEDYVETAAPFDYDLERIIVEGDKEKLEQLITRPAPGFESALGIIGFGCGVEVPDQPLMEADEFEDLEDRLLDEDDE